MRSILRRLAIAVPLAVVTCALADEASVRKTMEERHPTLKVQGVTKTPYAGLYEIRTEDNELIYTDEKVNFIFVGSIHDGREPSRNLTEERIRKLTAVKFEELPLVNAFKIVRGNGKRQLAYFSDPNCPYCRKLEEELLQVNDLTVHVFLYPILAADSAPKSRAVWCSSDRARAWLDMMLKGVQPPPGNCDAPMEKIIAFGQRIKVNSVPTLIFPSGDRVSGVRSAAQIDKMLAVGAK